MISLFALRLICGMSLMWCFMPRKEVTSGFFRIQMLVVLGLSVLASLTIHLPSPSSQSVVKVTETTSDAEIAPDQNLNDKSENTAVKQVHFMACITLAFAAFLGSILWTLERRWGGTACAFLLTILSAVLLLSYNVPAMSLTEPAGHLRWTSELTSAAILGGAVTSMLLGHWYLTTPAMSIASLSQLTWVYGGSAALRLVLSTVGLILGYGFLESTTHWTWLSLRWFAGVIGPLVVFVMVVRILKYRNTQSATGVLFVGVILSFIGEMTAVLLDQELHWPF